MFEPRHLKAYLALVKCMHFGRAAEMLGISQPTLSQQIRMLEEAVGAPLINRSNRTMELTPVGRVFAEDAQQILTLMERAKRNAEDILSGEEAVTVEIGEGRHNTIEKAVASFDGDTQISMVTGDRIVIRKATVRTKILKLNHLSFVEVLRQKMSNS